MARHATFFLTLLFLVLNFSAERGRAHKPITSPFTYNEDVFPIVRDRCARCHVPGGVAPMSLVTYEDTVPWGESIRVELLAGHMPPWSVDAAAARFRNAQPLSAREMNVLLTWATGGTPPGNPDKAPMPVSHDRRWPLGTPDLELQLREFTLAEDKQEDTAEFFVPTGFPERQWLRAVDLLPGTAAIVRAATVQIRPAARNAKAGVEPMLAVWLPGDDPIPAEGTSGFEVPAGAELLVRVRYKKTWQYERKAMTDRSTLGLYFAREASTPIRGIPLTADAPSQGGDARRQTFRQTITEDVRALAIYPTDHPSNAGIVVTAVSATGARRELIAFHPHRDWQRRYWFQEPVSLERGTTLETTVTIDDESPVVPAASGASPRQESLSIRLTLNVVAG
jgi:hypothetical protein